MFNNKKSNNAKYFGSGNDKMLTMYKKSQQKTIDVNTDPDQMHPFDDKFFGFNPPSRYPGIDLGSGINQNDPEGILTPVVEDIDLDTRKLSGHNDAQSNQHGDVN